MMFLAGAACCCILGVAVSCFMAYQATKQASAAYAEIEAIANRAHGKPYDTVINQMKSKYISTGLSSAGVPTAVFVYRIGTGSVGVTNRQDIFVGFGVDASNVVREVRWYKDGDGWPSAVQAKSVVAVVLL